MSSHFLCAVSWLTVAQKNYLHTKTFNIFTFNIFLNYTTLFYRIFDIFSVVEPPYDKICINTLTAI